MSLSSLAITANCCSGCSRFGGAAGCWRTAFFSHCPETFRGSFISGHTALEKTINNHVRCTFRVLTVSRHALELVLISITLFYQLPSCCDFIHCCHLLCPGIKLSLYIGWKWQTCQTACTLDLKSSKREGANMSISCHTAGSLHGSIGGSIYSRISIRGTTHKVSLAVRSQRSFCSVRFLMEDHCDDLRFYYGIVAKFYSVLGSIFKAGDSYFEKVHKALNPQIGLRYFNLDIMPLQMVSAARHFTTCR
eukprot:284814988_4